MPSPSHQGFFSDCALAAMGKSTGAKAVAANPLKRLLRDKSDFINRHSLERFVIHAVVSALKTNPPINRRRILLRTCAQLKVPTGGLNFNCANSQNSRSGATIEPCARRAFFVRLQKVNFPAMLIILLPPLTPVTAPKDEFPYCVFGLAN